jgi:hypothetical protein
MKEIGHLTGMLMTQANGAMATSDFPSDAGESNSDVERTEVRVTPARPQPPSSLDLMLARAHVVIAHMAPADPRARLLQVAVLRRDEILLEALLRRLDAAPSY